MTISLRCQQCGHAYQLRDELAGKKAKCRCGQTLVIPEAAPALAPLATLLDEADVVAPPPAAPPTAPAGSHRPRPSAAFGAAWGKKGSRRKGKNSALILAIVGGGVVGLLLVGLVIYLLTDSRPTGSPAASQAAAAGAPAEPAPGAPAVRWPTPEAAFKTYQGAVVAKDWKTVFEAVTPRLRREIIGGAAVIALHVAADRPDVQALLRKHGLADEKLTSADLIMAGRIAEATAAMRSEGEKVVNRIGESQEFFVEVLAVLDAPAAPGQSPVAMVFANLWNMTWQAQAHAIPGAIRVEGDNATADAVAQIGGMTIDLAARFQKIDGEWRVDDVDAKKPPGI